jgi:hypothetical protein
VEDDSQSNLSKFTIFNKFNLKKDGAKTAIGAK